ncbi:hypothetical protein AQUSIP_19430 [Aquicella siphonis]|uniref:Lipoprotein SmpA/OmlA domain-containing protein n=1 Tax=Aquicella siphonis TaxID=254247 RepID=A0A5E4PHW3_9COXI|nr:DUF3862 domain-containing protein [Aquicella siphonis]VVC76620.1 hypothetical protein AQUSIP_19430 [Aquicella siphonis]
MTQVYQFIRRLFLAACVCFILLGCSKLSQENFDKIQTNMTMKEVIAILGEPTSSESINIAGISGTSAVWKDSNAEIDIQFLNDRVTVKAYSKTHAQPDSSSSQERDKKN